MVVRDPWRSRIADSVLYSFALACSRPLYPLLRRLGVDVPRFRVLLETRLLLDFGIDAQASYGPLLVVVGFWLAGIAPGVAGILGASPLVWMSVLHGLGMLLLAVLLFAQWADVLVDPTDIRVLESRPVDDRTVFASRLAHTLLHTLVPMAFFASWSVFLGLFRQPLVAALVVVPVTTALASLLTLGLVGMLFAGLLRAVGPARFQRAVLWVRIGASIVLLGFGTFASLLQRLGLTSWIESRPELAALRFALPPVWYARTLDLVLGDVSTVTLACAAAGVVAPFAAVAVAFRLASRRFVAGLTGDLEVLPVSRSPWRVGPIQRALRNWARGDVQRAGFDFAWSLSLRERAAAKVLLIPALFPILWLANLQLGTSASRNPVEDSPWDAGLRSASGFLIGILALAFSGGTVQVRVPAAAVDVFRVLRREEQHALSIGQIKAVLARFLSPLVVLVLGLSALRGIEELVDSLLATAIGLTLSLEALYRMRTAVPFTGPPRNKSAVMDNLGVLLVYLMCTAAAAVAHVSLVAFAPAWVVALLLVPFSWIAWHQVRSLNRLRIEPLPDPAFD